MKDFNQSTTEGQFPEKLNDWAGILKVSLGKHFWAVDRL